MISVASQLIALISALYLIGNPIRQRKEIDQILKLAEGGYKNINKNICNIQTQEAITTIRDFCTKAFIAVAIALLPSTYWIKSQKLLIILSSLLIGTMIIRQSIQWIISHKKEFRTFARYGILVILSPLLILWIGNYSDMPQMPVDPKFISVVAEITGYKIPITLESQTIIFSIILLLGTTLIYLFTSAISFFILATVIAFIWTAKTTANVIDKAFPINNLQGLAVIIFTIATLISIFAK
ncbi:hypothetical protein H0A36_27835 [Endozoicomonas sp. SM1973]|uniref:Uncharacterized protein n=1 Tax=Spartinivicinus marinus TaxID=2994442 RepID=A0A853IKC3_9GAMM|nr:hypothetical protein [Spartinivicinus marinus]NYZ69827.1 hypothetical protein [Spartinivicinus marinus]